MHRKDSDRLPGYFVLRSGCQIVQGAVLTPAPTLILGSSTARVGCAPPLFLQQIIFCKIATIGMGERLPQYLLDLLFLEYLKIHVLVQVIRTSRPSLFWHKISTLGTGGCHSIC